MKSYPYYDHAAQTGVPFGEVAAVREFLGIDAKVRAPRLVHPKRPIEGFACTRSEVSGRRFWGLMAREFETPERFFARGFVWNWCPLAFMAESGANITPDKLVRAVRPAHALVFKGCQGLTLKGRVRILTDSPHMDLKCLVASSRATRHDLLEVV